MGWSVGCRQNRTQEEQEQGRLGVLSSTEGREEQRVGEREGGMEEGKERGEIPLYKCSANVISE